jgi:RNA polymerase sigma factor (sigma-70 family)
MPTSLPLVLAARAGDPEAFGVLVRDHARFAAAVALARTGRPEIADEVAQDALIDAWRLLPTLREPAAFAGWLRAVVVKHADRRTRRRAREVHEVDDQLPSGSDPEADAAAREDRRRVQRAVAALPPAQREVVALFHLSGCSQAEVADLLGVPGSTVKKRLHDARRRLVPLLLEVDMPVAENVPLTVQAFVAARAGRPDLLAPLLDARPELVRVVGRVDAEELAARYAPAGAGVTLLHEAVSAGRAEVARLLLARGADVDARTPGGLTPLLLALELDRAELVPLLLDAGADPSARLASGATALHVARHRGRDDLATRLVAAGADPASLDAHGRTAEDWRSFPGHVRAGAEGRVIDPSGRPLDRGPTVVLPDRTPADPDLTALPTGLKCLDLLAPLARRGVHRLVAGAGVGKIVLVGELGRALPGPVVVAGLLDRTWDVLDFEPVLRELGLWSGSTVVMGASAEDHRALVRAALGLAEAAGGWVVADDRLEGELLAQGPGVPVVTFGPHVVPDPIPARGPAVARVVLDPARAARGEWPAFDPLRSESVAAVSADQRALADAVRAAIAEGGPRADRLLAWLTQPFRVAEAWTGRPGEVVPLERTLADAAALLGG